MSLTRARPNLSLAFRFLTDNGLFSWVLPGEANSSVAFCASSNPDIETCTPKPTSSQLYSPCFVVRRRNPSNLPWSHLGRFYSRNYRMFYYQIFSTDLGQLAYQLWVIPQNLFPSQFLPSRFVHSEFCLNLWAFNHRSPFLYEILRYTRFWLLW